MPPEIITFEFVTSAPVDEIVELYRAGGWWREDDTCRALIPRLMLGSFCFLVARDGGGQIVGMGRVLSDGVCDAYIQDVVVLAAHRSRGIGREIVRRLTERCVAAGIGWIGLVAEPGTEFFYEPLGFRALAGYRLMLHRSREE